MQLLFSIAELRVHKTLQKKEKLNAVDLLGPAPDLIAYSSPVLADVEADLVGAEVLVSGKVETEIRCTCSRCLTDFEMPMKSSFRQSVVVSEEPVDAAPYIKESILLELPVKALCRESCQGLCASCGTNENEVPCTCELKKSHPQWDALKNFPLH